MGSEGSLPLLVRGERLIAQLGDARLRARKEERTWLLELTAGAPELHGRQYVEIDDASEQFLYSVDLDYGEYDPDGEPTGEWAVRPDRFSFYRAGFEVRTVRRCRRLLVRVHEPDVPARIVRSYNLRYDNSAPNGLSLLRSMEVTGYAPAESGDIEGAVLPDGARVIGRHRALSMSPLELSYSDFGYADHVAAADAALEQARAGDKGWRRDAMEEAARAALAESRPSWEYGDLRLVPVDDRPGVSEDRAHFVAVGDDGAVRVILARHDDRWVAERVESRGSVRDLTVEGGALPPGGLDHPDFELIDLDGYGLPGIVWFGAAHNGSAGQARHQYWAGIGDATLSPQRDQAGPPVSFADPDVNFADMTGEGTADLLFTAGSPNGFYETWRGQGWTDATFRAFVEQPSFNLEDRRVELVDADGDGRVEVLDTSGDHVRVYVNRDDRWLEIDVDEEPPEVSLGDSNGAVRLADISGDGPLDIVRVLNGRVDCWPHFGHGRFGKRLTFTNPPRIAGQFDPGRVVLADVDGDGYADFVYLGDEELTVCLNRSGNGFSGPIPVRWPAGRLEAESVRGCDMLGIGTAGLLWSETRRAGDGESVNYRFLDLTTERKPYLLTGISNGLGVETSIKYESSSRQYLRDREEMTRGAGARSHTSPWATELPFPVQVVTRIESCEHVTGQRTCVEYRYHHGHWDGEEREFRGFGLVDRFDSETVTEEEVPGAYGEHWSP